MTELPQLAPLWRRALYRMGLALNSELEEAERALMYARSDLQHAERRIQAQAREIDAFKHAEAERVRQDYLRKLEGRTSGPLTEARDAFLTLIADAKQFSVDYDADCDSNGRAVDCSTFCLYGKPDALEEFCKTLGIEQKWISVDPTDPSYGTTLESIDEAIQRYIEAPVL